MGHTGLVGSVNIVVGGTRMSDGRQNTVVAARLDEFYGAWQFGSLVPALETGAFFQNLVVFFGLRRFNPFGNLRTGLGGVEIRALEVETHHGAVGLVHKFLTCLDGGFNHLDCRRREGGIDGCGAILQVGVYGYAERLFGAFHEVAADTAVYVQLNATRHHIGTTGVNYLCIDNVEVGGENGLDFVAVYYDRTALKPTLRRENAAIYNLFHSRYWFKGLFE